MFRALLGGGRPSSDLCSDTDSKSSRRKATDDDVRSTSSRRSKPSASSSSHKSSRGDDRDRGLGDLSAYSSSGSRRRYAPSMTEGSVASTYVTAEPGSIYDDSNSTITERTSKYTEADNGDDRASEALGRNERRRNGSERADSRERRRERRDRSRSRDRGETRKDTKDRKGKDTDQDRDRDSARKERRRTRSGDEYSEASRAATTLGPDGRFAAEITSPGFSQFPGQYDTTMSGAVPLSPSSYDPHVPHQFPGQFPQYVPYRPPHPAGEAAEYYGDQGESVAQQPGVRPKPPTLIVGAEPHLMSASPVANPPPEPSSMGQVGSAADYYANHSDFPDHAGEQPSRPPKPSKPSKPSGPAAVVPAAALGAATYGIGPGLPSSPGVQHLSSSLAGEGPSTIYASPVSTSGPNGTSHSHGAEAALGAAAAGAAASYMMGHHSSSHHEEYSMHYESSSYPGPPYVTVTNGKPPKPDHDGSSALFDAGIGGASGYSALAAGHAAHSQPAYPGNQILPGTLAFHQRHHGPLDRFINFWRDPEGVGMYEDYTEAIGVCKYCFEPGTTSKDAPRKHHYNRRKLAGDRYGGAASRIEKSGRYSSEEENRRRRSRERSWLAGGLAGGLPGYVTKSLFTSKDFDGTYSVRSGRVTGSTYSVNESESVLSLGRKSYASHGASHRTQHGDYKDRFEKGSIVVSKTSGSELSRRRSRSRSRSRERHSALRDAAIGVAIGTAAGAAMKSRRRSHRSRKASSSSSGSYVDIGRSINKSSSTGFTSFFSASSANRRKQHAKQRKSFFSFGNSSSSSSDADLAFGSAFLRKSKRLSKSSKSSRSSGSSRSSKKKDKHDIDGEILRLGVTAKAIADAADRRGKRISGALVAKDDRSRRSTYASSGLEDDEWEDADSSESASSVSSALAYGGSALFGSSPSDSGTSKWSWRWGSKKKKKKNKSGESSEYLPAVELPAGAFAGAAIESAYGKDTAVQSQDGSSSVGSLRRVYPQPTSDPSRYDVVTLPPMPTGGQPQFVRPGPIPLQQPQPITPVSQSVYATQAGPSPSYVAPSGPPVFAEATQYDTTTATPAGSSVSLRTSGTHRRSDSTPVFPTEPLEESLPSVLKRRSTSKDQASVQFELTKEQADKERRADRLERKKRGTEREEIVGWVREKEERSKDIERRERRRLEKESESGRRNEEYDARSSALHAYYEREKRSSSWVSVAEGAAIGVAAGAVIAEKASGAASESRQRRHEELREKRRAERRRNSETEEARSSISSLQKIQHVSEEVILENKVVEAATSSIPGYVGHVHESYGQFFAPEELRHRSDAPSPRAEERADVKIASEMGRPSEVTHATLPWPVPHLNVIEPTPPQSLNGSVRGAASPIVLPATVPEEDQEEERHEDQRPGAGSRVSWGEHQTHEYEVHSDVEQELTKQERIHDESIITSIKGESPEEVKPAIEYEIEKDNVPGNGVPAGFEDDIEFAATLAAGAAAAGFDPAVVTDNPTYHRRSSPPGSEARGVYMSPWVETVSDLQRPVPPVQGCVEGEVETPDDNDKPLGHITEGTEFPAEPVQITEANDDKSRDLSKCEVSLKTARERSIAREVIERLNEKGESWPQEESKRTADSSPERPTDDSNYVSMDEGPPTPKASEKNSKRDSDSTRGESRSVASAPVGDYTDTRKSRKSRRSGDDFDVRSGTGSLDDNDEKKRRRRRSKRDSEILEEEEEEEAEESSRRRRKSHRDSWVFDDSGSVASSPAKFDESREKRKSKDKESVKEKEKKSGGLFSSLFGSKVSSAGEKSTSGEKDKRSSRDVQSEVGVDEYESSRRHKKHSSKHRSSSGDRGLGLSNGAAQSLTDLSQVGRDFEQDDDAQSPDADEFYKSHRQRRDERRRQIYEDIVESGEVSSDKDRKAQDDVDQPRSFLAERPEMPVTAGDDNGASGLDSFVDASRGSAQHRSSSESPVSGDKEVDMPLRSRSRTVSASPSRQKQRRLSVLRPTDLASSPTAVPLHFRRPPISPGVHRSPPSISSSSAQSPVSPSQQRFGHRSRNSTEFKNAREFRPLWLVERHSSGKFDQPLDELLPSLPSSKTTSRSTSVEDFKSLRSEDVIPSWQTQDVTQMLDQRRRPIGLTISIADPSEHTDHAILGSQQTTPTAETFPGYQTITVVKKEKPKYEFHSPSELLQDPCAFIPLPPSPMLPPLPPAEGSAVGTKEQENEEQEPEPNIGELPSLPESRPSSPTVQRSFTPTQEGRFTFSEAVPQSSAVFPSLKGAALGIVDSAVSAVSNAEKLKEKLTAPENEAVPEIKVDLLTTNKAEDGDADKPSASTAPKHDDIAPVSATEIAPRDATVGRPLSPPRQPRSRSTSPFTKGGFGDVVDVAVFAAVKAAEKTKSRGHEPTLGENRDQTVVIPESEKPLDAQQLLQAEKGFPAIIDAAVAAAVGAEIVTKLSEQNEQLESDKTKPDDAGTSVAKEETSKDVEEPSGGISAVPGGAAAAENEQRAEAVQDEYKRVEEPVKERSQEATEACSGPLSKNQKKKAKKAKKGASLDLTSQEPASTPETLTPATPAVDLVNAESLREPNEIPPEVETPTTQVDVPAEPESSKQVEEEQQGQTEDVSTPTSFKESKRDKKKRKSKSSVSEDQPEDLNNAEVTQLPHEGQPEEPAIDQVEPPKDEEDFSKLQDEGQKIAEQTLQPSIDDQPEQLAVDAVEVPKAGDEAPKVHDDEQKLGEEATALDSTAEVVADESPSGAGAAQVEAVETESAVPESGVENAPIEATSNSEWAEPSGKKSKIDLPVESAVETGEKLDVENRADEVTTAEPERVNDQPQDRPQDQLQEHSQDLQPLEETPVREIVPEAVATPSPAIENAVDDARVGPALSRKKSKKEKRKSKEAEKLAVSSEASPAAVYQPAAPAIDNAEGTPATGAEDVDKIMTTEELPAEEIQEEEAVPAPETEREAPESAAEAVMKDKPENAPAIVPSEEAASQANPDELWDEPPKKSKKNKKNRKSASLSEPEPEQPKQSDVVDAAQAQTALPSGEVAKTNMTVDLAIPAGVAVVELLGSEPVETVHQSIYSVEIDETNDRQPHVSPQTKPEDDSLSPTTSPSKECEKDNNTEDPQPASQDEVGDSTAAVAVAEADTSSIPIADTTPSDQAPPATEEIKSIEEEAAKDTVVEPAREERLGEEAQMTPAQKRKAKKDKKKRQSLLEEETPAPEATEQCVNESVPSAAEATPVVADVPVDENLNEQEVVVQEEQSVTELQESKDVNEEFVEEFQSAKSKKKAKKEKKKRQSLALSEEPSTPSKTDDVAETTQPTVEGSITEGPPAIVEQPNQPEQLAQEPPTVEPESAVQEDLPVLEQPASEPQGVEDAAKEPAEEFSSAKSKKKANKDKKKRQSLALTEEATATEEVTEVTEAAPPIDEVAAVVESSPAKAVETESIGQPTPEVAVAEIPASEEVAKEQPDEVTTTESKEEAQGSALKEENALVEHEAIITSVPIKEAQQPTTEEPASPAVDEFQTAKSKKKAKKSKKNRASISQIEDVPSSTEGQTAAADTSEQTKDEQPLNESPVEQAAEVKDSTADVSAEKSIEQPREDRPEESAVVGSESNIPTTNEPEATLVTEAVHDAPVIDTKERDVAESETRKDEEVGDQISVPEPSLESTVESPTEATTEASAEATAEHTAEPTAELTADLKEQTPVEAEPEAEFSSAKSKKKSKKDKKKRQSADWTEEVPAATAEEVGKVEGEDNNEKTRDTSITQSELPAASTEAPVEDGEEFVSAKAKRKAKKDKKKRQSVTWEDEIPAITTEDKPAESIESPSDAQMATDKNLSQDAPVKTSSDEIVAAQELKSAETLLPPQEMPAEGDGKENQSSEEKKTDDREREPDWTDEMASSQAEQEKSISPVLPPQPPSESIESEISTPITLVTEPELTETVTTAKKEVESGEKEQKDQKEQKEDEQALGAGEAVATNEGQDEEAPWTVPTKKSKKDKKKKRRSAALSEEASVTAEVPPNPEIVDRSERNADSSAETGEQMSAEVAEAPFVPEEVADAEDSMQPAPEQSAPANNEEPGLEPEKFEPAGPEGASEKDKESPSPTQTAEPQPQQNEMAATEEQVTSSAPAEGESQLEAQVLDDAKETTEADPEDIWTTSGKNKKKDKKKNRTSALLDQDEKPEATAIETTEVTGDTTQGATEDSKELLKNEPEEEWSGISKKKSIKEKKKRASLIDETASSPQTGDQPPLTNVSPAIPTEDSPDFVAETVEDQQATEKIPEEPAEAFWAVSTKKGKKKGKKSKSSQDTGSISTLTTLPMDRTEQKEEPRVAVDDESPATPFDNVQAGGTSAEERVITSLQELPIAPEPAQASISLDPFDVPSDAENAAEPSIAHDAKEVVDLGLDASVSEEALLKAQEESQDRLRRRALEQDSDLTLAEDLFGDRARESITETPSAESKKEGMTFSQKTIAQVEKQEPEAAPQEESSAQEKSQYEEMLLTRTSSKKKNKKKRKDTISLEPEEPKAEETEKAVQPEPEAQISTLAEEPNTVPTGELDPFSTDDSWPPIEWDEGITDIARSLGEQSATKEPPEEFPVVVVDHGPGVIGDFPDTPELRDETKQPEEPSGEDLWTGPLSKKEKKKNKKKKAQGEASAASEQRDEAIEPPEQSLLTSEPTVIEPSTPVADEPEDQDELWSTTTKKGKKGKRQSQSLELNGEQPPKVPREQSISVEEKAAEETDENTKDGEKVVQEKMELRETQEKSVENEEKERAPVREEAVLMPQPTLEPIISVEEKVQEKSRLLRQSKIASIFPNLERVSFKRPVHRSVDRSSLENLTESRKHPKEVAEDETGTYANRDSAIQVSEAPLAEDAYTIRDSGYAPTEQQTKDDLGEGLDISVEVDPSYDVSVHKDQSIEIHWENEDKPDLPPAAKKVRRKTSPMEASSKDRRSSVSKSEGLHRTASIHGRHQHKGHPLKWSLESEKSSKPQINSDAVVTTPLGTIREHDEAKLLGPEHRLTPSITDGALSRLSDGQRSRQLKTPEQGAPVMRSSSVGSVGSIHSRQSGTPPLRRVSRNISGDLRAVSRLEGEKEEKEKQKRDIQEAGRRSQPQEDELHLIIPSSSTYDPVTDKGKRPLRGMADVYEGWGETPSSPRSPTRPASVRRRRSMQYLQELETRLDQLISENRLLAAARDEAEHKIRSLSSARRKSDQALNRSDADLRDKDAEITQLKNSLDWMQKEVARLTEENEGLTATNAGMEAAHHRELKEAREASARELEELRSQHRQLSTGMEGIVRHEIETALAEKNEELRRLRAELVATRDKVQELQRQITASLQEDDVIVPRDEDYFDAACQKLCQHVQQWVLRFSKHSDLRRCRQLSEIHDEKIADRFDNAILDGSDVDTYLADRVRRRDVFMSVVMSMVWEYIFTRYLFGMDREQRQKLKTLEKQLAEVGSRRAVSRWRATTLTLLARRPAFARQRANDTEAVAREIFGTLSRLLPPPSVVETTLLDSLRSVLRVAADLSIEMRTQRAEYVMLPPLQPEFDTNGDLARQVYFNASLMNERSGETTSNEALEAQRAVVRLVLFPLVVKKGNDLGEGDEEIVVCPAQVLVAHEKKVVRVLSGDRMSNAPSAMSNMI